MVSLDDAVIARLEKGGNRYEILVDPDLVAEWKINPEQVSFEDMLATDEVWSDLRRAGEYIRDHRSPFLRRAYSYRWKHSVDHRSAEENG